MANDAIYYLGRVAKSGVLDSEKIINAILNPKPVDWFGKRWSFFDAQRFSARGGDFVYARLSKYNPEGEVIISDPSTKKEMAQSEPNLRVAASNFIYIPKYSGIVFTKDAIHINEFQFSNRFAHIIANTYDDFFVDCTVSLIVDLRKFYEKLSLLKGIYKISATVNPPNPLFGPLWRPLDKYLKSRDTDKMLVREQAGEDNPIKTDLPGYVKKVIDQSENDPYVPEEDLPIGDAAILMAADGYGAGFVQGRQEGLEMVTIKTSETNRNFTYPKDADPMDLYSQASEIFERIEKDRHMEHGDG
jgi:hypothetical protein